MNLSVKGMVERMRQRVNTKRTIDALNKLNDRELADIGLHRAQIMSVATELLEIHRKERDDHGNSI